MTIQRDDLARLGSIPRDEEGPVFKEPWEAQAFALAVRLSEEGHFTWDEWAATLSDEIAKARAAGDPDLGDTYYHHWVAALERLCAEKGLVALDSMGQRKEEWRRAYLNTPHGKPIELSAAFRRDRRPSK
jgi:nitrile hydratase accessory protein